MRLSRADRSVVAEWWFSVDKTSISLIFALGAVGVVLSLGASPAVAQKLRLPEFHFVVRQALFAAAAAPILIGMSMLPPRRIRQLALLITAAGLALMAAALAQGEERNGAVRWITLGGVSLQPSEFVKPGFIVLSAWLLAEGRRDPAMPALPLALALLALFAALLAAQPDIGQMLLILAAWGCMFFVAGYPLAWMGAFAAAMLACAGAAYLATDHVKKRIDQFLAGGAADENAQAEIALSAFREGGWFGRGPGEGVLKMTLPDSHTDYVLAVAAEEFGVISCLFIVVIYALITWRGLTIRSGAANDFCNLAKFGLLTLFAVQALANIAVNIGMLPAKGVTLPLISYGGSSLLSAAIMLGMALALGRRVAAADAGRDFAYEAGTAPSREMRT
ncbi:MAG: FtsW/RodA/SpoVE family cell cycle protein [Hyphomicrobiales bacterium]|nr:FtsW/RodA/SpoVE family cell cycle protein [Hyphomicrobiales bacterium]